MAKFYGKIGYCRQVEEVGPDGVGTGIWVNETIEKNHFGDVLRFNAKWDRSSELHDNIGINNQLSIVADSFAYNNLNYIRYVEWMGTKWTITNIDVQYPRLILTVGGEYNGQ